MKFLKALSPARFVRQLVAKIERRRKFKRALEHNKRHTFRSDVRNTVGGTWCCPTCNTIHRCSSSNQFTGRQFPACCEFDRGHRLFGSHATGL